MEKTTYEKKIAEALKAPLLCWDFYTKGLCNLVSYRDVLIGGFINTTLVDYPGNISAVMFTSGCNFRCRYCHNPSLVVPSQIKSQKCYQADALLEYCINNRKMLDAVVVTGGEPTLHKALPNLLEEIKKLGLKVKLDTNGTNTEMLKCCIKHGLVDYVAMDIKAPLSVSKYRTIVGYSLNKDQMQNVKRCVDVLGSEVVDYEFRTTLDGLLCVEDIKSIAIHIHGRYYLQKVLDNGSLLKGTPQRHFDYRNIISKLDSRQQLQVFLR